MNTNHPPGMPKQRTIWIPLLINLLICWTLLPLLLQPDQVYTGKQLIETLLWQLMALVAWPINLVSAVFSLINLGNLAALGTLLKILIYPAGLFCFMLVFILKHNKWIPVIIVHILLIISFWVTWLPVLRGYDFMVGKFFEITRVAVENL